MQSMNFHTLEEINPNPDLWPCYVPYLEGGQRPNTAAPQLPRAGGNLSLHSPGGLGATKPISPPWVST